MISFDGLEEKDVDKVKEVVDDFINLCGNLVAGKEVNLMVCYNNEQYAGLLFECDDFMVLYRLENDELKPYSIKNYKDEKALMINDIGNKSYYIHYDVDQVDIFYEDKKEYHKLLFSDTLGGTIAYNILPLDKSSCITYYFKQSKVESRQDVRPFIFQQRLNDITGFREEKNDKLILEYQKIELAGMLDYFIVLLSKAKSKEDFLYKYNLAKEDCFSSKEMFVRIYGYINKYYVLHYPFMDIRDDREIYDYLNKNNMNYRVPNDLLSLYNNNLENIRFIIDVYTSFMKCNDKDNEFTRKLQKSE